MAEDTKEDQNLKRIGVEIDKTLWDEFRAFVKKKYKRTHGVLSLEVEEALKQLMMDEGFLEEDHHPAPEDDQPPLDHFGKKETPTPKKEAVHKQDQPSETDAYIAAIDPKYGPIMAEINEYDEISRQDVEKILTRRLNLTTDKSRRDHIKTLEYCGIFEPHKQIGRKILTVNHDLLQNHLP